MKLQERVGTVESSEEVVSYQFSFDQTRKAFEILSSSLYSHKVRAVVRELCTNAWDSHIAAGNLEQPFEVHLPSTMEPYFSVRDYGTGMTPEVVQTLYTVYFRSSRTDSDEFTGALGLGSKSPFAYTDQFSVTSVVNGWKTVYTVFITEEGIPAVTRLLHEDTGDPNGVEIKLGVRLPDFQEFSREAATVLSYFPKRPVVSGARGFTYDARQYYHEAERFALFRYRGTVCQVVMGNVAYALAYLDLNLQPNALRLCEHGIELRLPIGTLEVAPSREQLSYDKRTKKNLTLLLNEAVDEVREHFSTRIATAPNLWAARKAVHNLHKDISAKLLPDNLLWQGQVIEDVVQLSRYNCPYDVVKVGKATVNDKYFTASKPVVMHSVEADDTPVYLQNDDEIHLYQRVLQDVPGYCAILIKPWDAEKKKQQHELFLVDVKVREEKKLPAPVDQTTLPDFLTASGIDLVAKPTANLSPYVPPPQTASGTPRVGQGFGAIKKTKLLEFIWPSELTKDWPPYRQRQESSYNYWKAATVNAKDGGVYVICRRGNVQLPGLGNTDEFINPHNLDRNFEAFYKLHQFTLYGIRPADLDMLLKHKGKWVQLDVYREKFAKQWEKMKPKLQAYLACVQFNNTHDFKPFFRKHFLPASPFGKFIEEVKNFQASGSQELNRYHAFLTKRDDVPVYDKEVTELEIRWQALEKRYPLFKHLDFDRINAPFAEVVTDYIKLVDK